MGDSISREELKAKLDRGDPMILVDALPEPTYHHAHMPGAVNIPSGLVSELAPQRLPADRGAAIVVYCSSAT